VAYAIISLGGKQYIVREGETLLVDRLDREEGKSFQPDVLFLGGNGKAELSPKASVTAKVVGHERGPKVRIGKYKPKSGYKRQTGFRASLTRIEVTGIGARKAATKAEKEPAASKTERAQVAPKAEKAQVAPKAEKAAVAPKAEKMPVAAKPEKPADAPKGLPRGYAELTVAQVAEGSKTWNRPMLEAALAYEQQHATRKGAIAALESALKAKDEA
jgi:large subunit ribosomal protein L21